MIAGDRVIGRANVEANSRCRRVPLPADAGFGISPAGFRFAHACKPAQLRIDLHHIKRPAYHIDLGNAGSKSICVRIEDIDLRALHHLNNVAAGDRLHSCNVKVLPEGRFWGEDSGRGAGIENAQAAADGIGGRAGQASLEITGRAAWIGAKQSDLGSAAR